MVERFGEPLAGSTAGDALRLVFPEPRRLATADVAALGMPRTRAAAVVALARAAAADPRLFGTAQSLDDAIARLRALPGVGPWTAQYVALRALREPDAFPEGDVGLLRALEDAAGRRPTARELVARAEAWRPWRAYAAQHLWTSDAPALDAQRSRPGSNVGVDDDANRNVAAALRPRDDADRRPAAAAGR
jgi:AraC family transcriptional regulator of adaptative response / DNA-3-methyladenine glycosylase II